MIAKKVLSKKAQRSARGLVSYILDESKGDKVGEVFINNCYSLDPMLALKEIEIIQERNDRAKSDKTYHLVVSFPANEVPTTEQLNDIEQLLCDSVGLGHHQRISATHINTDNYHLHVAINKIDPDTLKIVDQYRDAISLMKCCAELEIKHGLKLEHSNFSEKQHTYSDNKMDHHSGEGSLLSWIIDNVKPELEDVISHAKSWQDLHDLLSDKGLVLERYRSGMVIKDIEKNISVKASSVSKHLSLKKLEAVIGKFTPCSEFDKSQASKYSKDKNDHLYNSYKSFKEEQKQTQKSKLLALKNNASKQRLQLRLENELARQKLKSSVMSGYLKRGAYKRLAANHRVAQKIVTTHYSNERKKVFKQHPSMTFRDYLQYRAKDGHRASLVKLRAKNPRSSTLNGITGKGDKFLSHNIQEVDKHGRINYQMTGTQICDDGKKLSIDDNSVSVKPLVEMAILKYGRDLTVEGDETFKRKVEACIKENNLNVRLSGMKSPVEEYIDKRNNDRVKIPSIPVHKLFREGQFGTFSFEGYRNIRDESVVLLKQTNTIYVKSIPRSDLSYYKSLHKGENLSIPPQHNHEQDFEHDL